MPPPTCARGDLCLSFLFITPFRRRRGGTNKPGPRLRALNARVSPSARFATGVRTVVEWCGLPHAAARAVGYGGPKQRAPRPAHPPVGPGVARGRFALKIAPGPGPVGGGVPCSQGAEGVGNRRPGGAARRVERSCGTAGAASAATHRASVQAVDNNQAGAWPCRAQGERALGEGGGKGKRGGGEEAEGRREGGEA